MFDPIITVTVILAALILAGVLLERWQDSRRGPDTTMANGWKEFIKDGKFIGRGCAIKDSVESIHYYVEDDFHLAARRYLSEPSSAVYVGESSEKFWQAVRELRDAERD